MSKQDPYSKDDVSSLMKKLQATFLSDDQPDKKQKMDEDDRAFRNKLASLLERLSRPPQKKKNDLPSVGETDAEKIDATAAPTSEASVPVTRTEQATPPTDTVESDIPSDAPVAQAAEQTIEENPPSPAPKKRKPRTPKPREKKASQEANAEKKSDSLPAATDVTTTLEEMPVEDVPMEDTSVEDTSVEDTSIEDTSAVTSSAEIAPIADEESPSPERIAEEDAKSSKPRHPLDYVIPIEEDAANTVESVPTEPTAEDNTTEDDTAEKAATEAPTAESEDTETPIKVEPMTNEAPTDEPVTERNTASPTVEGNVLSEVAHAPTRKTVLEPKASNAPKKKDPPRDTAPSATVIPSSAECEKQRTDKPPSAEIKGDGSTRPITVKAPTAREVRSTAHTEPDAIVIRPPAPEHVRNETIVIRPKSAQKPQPVPRAIEEQPSAQPIKIGKESPPASAPHTVRAESGGQSPKNMKKDTPKVTTETPSTPPVESPKKPPSISAIRKAPDASPASDAPASPDVKAKDTSKSRAGGVTLPRESATVKKKATAKRKSTKVTATVRENSDERFEEVLDEKLITEPFAEEIPVDEPEEISPPTHKLSIFQRKQKRKEEREEASLSALDLICKRSGLTPDDIAMIFELGYESELGRLVGYEALKRLKTEHLRQMEQHASHHYRTAFGYRGEEWIGNHRDAVLAAYVHDRSHVLTRLILTVVLSVLLFFAEAPTLIGIPLLPLSTVSPLLLPIVGMLLFVCVSLLSLGQIEAGARALLRFSPTPYSVCAILPPFVLIYDLLTLFVKSPMPQANLTASIPFLVIALCDLLRLCSEMQTLRIVSSEGPKQMLSAAPPRKKKLRSGEKIVKIINDDLGENLYQVKPGLRTVGFFRRSNNLTTASRTFTVQIIAMLSLATLLALVSSVQSSSASTALATFLSVLLVATPTSAIFTYFYPLCRANRQLAKRGCTLVGEESVDELNKPKTVIFPDTKLYTAQKSTQLSIRTGDDFRTDLRLVSALLRRLGGTAEQITNGTRPTREDPPVSIVRIQDGGIEAMVDHSNHLLLGNVEFMKRGGIRIPRESSDVALSRPESVSMMYVAINGVLKFSYEVEYAPSATLDTMIRDLAESDTAVAIHTYDPNLNDAFLQTARGEDADPVRVIKPGRFEEDRPQELVDAAAVATEDALDALAPIHAAKAISNVRKFGFRMQLIGSLIGSAAILVLAFLDKLGTLGMLPIAAYQGFWILVSLCSAIGEINPRRLHF